MRFKFYSEAEMKILVFKRSNKELCVSLNVLRDLKGGCEWAEKSMEMGKKKMRRVARSEKGRNVLGREEVWRDRQD